MGFRRVAKERESVTRARMEMTHGEPATLCLQRRSPGAISVVPAGSTRTWFTAGGSPASNSGAM